MADTLLALSLRRVGHTRVAAAAAWVARARARVASLRGHAGSFDVCRRALEHRDSERLDEVERLCIPMHFFDRHSGFPLNLPMGYGFGQGIVDFTSWEVGSGRLHPERGSRWWRTVNGHMVLDLARASAALRDGSRCSGDPVVDAWLAYVHTVDSYRERTRRGYVARAQGLFWNAHQRSLHRGLALAQGELVHESSLERAFIDRIVLHNVDYAALAGDPSFLDAIALYTFALYPLHRGDYAATRDDLARCLFARIERIPLSRSYGKRFENIGRTSARWHEGPLHTGPRSPLVQSEARAC